MSEAEGCPFCAIGSGASAASIVDRTPGALAFFPLRPAVLGHTLIIPRRHVAHLWDLDRADGPPLFDAALRVAGAIRRGLDPDGLNLITSAGEAATQSVLHLHLHLVPRWAGDGFGDIWPSTPPDLGEGELHRALEAIRAALPR